LCNTKKSNCLLMKPSIDLIKIGVSWCHITCSQWHPEVVIDTGNFSNEGKDGTILISLCGIGKKVIRMRAINFKDEKILGCCDICQDDSGSKALI
jgi:hypothetical protein